MQGHSTVRMDIPENYEAIFSFIFGSILSHIPLSQERERERVERECRLTVEVLNAFTCFLFPVLLLFGFVFCCCLCLIVCLF